MAITKTIAIDRIEVVTDYKHLQVRTATIIKEDGVELSRSFDRKTLVCGRLKGGTGSDKDTLVDTDISKEDAQVQSIAGVVWTNSVKTAWTAHLVATKDS